MPWNLTGGTLSVNCKNDVRGMMQSQDAFGTVPPTSSQAFLSLRKMRSCLNNHKQCTRSSMIIGKGPLFNVVLIQEKQFT